jgi:hypothetical protein
MSQKRWVRAAHGRARAAKTHYFLYKQTKTRFLRIFLFLTAYFADITSSSLLICEYSYKNYPHSSLYTVACLAGGWCKAGHCANAAYSAIVISVASAKF